jgi:hypothetical protein
MSNTGTVILPKRRIRASQLIGNLSQNFGTEAAASTRERYVRGDGSDSAKTISDKEVLPTGFHCGKIFKVD